jgi:hypothetical protein
MQKSEIQVGKDYALREGKSPDAPIHRVKIIQHVRGKKWKAEWIDPNPGLVEYVESQNLLVPWKEKKAFFRDEEKAHQLRENNERHGYKEDSPMASVLYQVFESLGEKDLSFLQRSPLWSSRCTGPSQGAGWSRSNEDFRICLCRSSWNCTYSLHRGS